MHSPRSVTFWLRMGYASCKSLQPNLWVGCLQSALVKKAEDTEGDAAELSATKLRLQQQNSMALVVTEPRANGGPHLPILKPSVTAVQRVRYQTPPLSVFFRFSVDYCQTGVLPYVVNKEGGRKEVEVFYWKKCWNITQGG